MHHYITHPLHTPLHLPPFGLSLSCDWAGVRVWYVVTKSKTLCQRRHCPESFLLPSTASWESMLAALVGHFGLELIPSQFYTRCTLCNGTFEQVTVAELKWTAPKDAPRRIVEEGKDEMGQQLTFFRCIDCSQVSVLAMPLAAAPTTRTAYAHRTCPRCVCSRYWWGTKSHGSAKKFKSARAHHSSAPSSMRSDAPRSPSSVGVVLYAHRTMFDRLARGNEAMPALPVQPTVRRQDGDKEESKSEERPCDTSEAADAAAYTATLSIAASLFAAPASSHSHRLNLRSAYAEYNRHALPPSSPPLSPSSSASHFEPAYTNLTDKVSAATPSQSLQPLPRSLPAAAPFQLLCLSANLCRCSPRSSVTPSTICFTVTRMLVTAAPMSLLRR